MKTCLSNIPDPRRAQATVYDLSHLLLFRILAVLSGATLYRKIQRFIHARRGWLKALCGLSWKHAPVHTSPFDMQVFDPRRRGWTAREETDYYLVTLTLTAAPAATLIRDSWRSENRRHYVREVTLREEASRIRRNSGLFAVLRRFALTLLYLNGIQNIS